MVELTQPQQEILKKALEENPGLAIYAEKNPMLAISLYTSKHASEAMPLNTSQSSMSGTYTILPTVLITKEDRVECSQCHARNNGVTIGSVVECVKCKRQRRMIPKRMEKYFAGDTESSAIWYYFSNGKPSNDSLFEIGKIYRVRARRSQREASFNKTMFPTYFIDSVVESRDLSSMPMLPSTEVPKQADEELRKKIRFHLSFNTKGQEKMVFDKYLQGIKQDPATFYTRYADLVTVVEGMVRVKPLPPTTS